ncbi:MAG: hypothetical protein AB7E52_09690 [Bdellovibrionales bacterium]
MRCLDPSAEDGERATVCTFCELTALLDRAGLTAAGFLVWMPELSQAELNNAVRALYVARDAKDSPLVKMANRTLEVLTTRRAEAKKRLGTDDPLLLATALHEQLDDTAYAARIEKLEGIRFLPLDRYLVPQRSGRDVNVFPRMMAYWTSPEGPYGKVPVSEWEALFKSVREKAAAEVSQEPVAEATS